MIKYLVGFFNSENRLAFYLPIKAATPEQAEIKAKEWYKYNKDKVTDNVHVGDVVEE